jgi:hypothetical protein
MFHTFTAVIETIILITLFFVAGVFHKQGAPKSRCPEGAASNCAERVGLRQAANV